MSVDIIRGDARKLPLPDASVDLIVTSPPYFALRSYTDGGEHYDGQVGSEPTPAEFVDALIECTTEMVRVLKPSGSIFVNLGDKYAGGGGFSPNSPVNVARRDAGSGVDGKFRFSPRTNAGQAPAPKVRADVPTKSLMGIPWRYALRCIDDLGLILRAEIIWSKPNGLPESVTDRVRRSHEQWFHFTVMPRYFSSVDEIRETQSSLGRTQGGPNGRDHRLEDGTRSARMGSLDTLHLNPLGKLPGSVWTIPTQPLTVPAHLGVDHFAAFPMEWPRRLISGWCPREVCTVCGEGRRPVADKEHTIQDLYPDAAVPGLNNRNRTEYRGRRSVCVTLTGYTCACPTPDAPSTPGVALDPFGGTGTTALVAHALGRHGISVDLSSDYCRLAEWRISDPGELARALEVPKPPVQVDGQLGMFDDEVVA